MEAGGWGGHAPVANLQHQGQLHVSGGHLIICARTHTRRATGLGLLLELVPGEGTDARRAFTPGMRRRLAEEATALWPWRAEHGIS